VLPRGETYGRGKKRRRDGLIQKKVRAGDKGSRLKSSPGCPSKERKASKRRRSALDDKRGGEERKRKTERCVLLTSGGSAQASGEGGSIRGKKTYQSEWRGKGTREGKRRNGPAPAK